MAFKLSIQDLTSSEIDKRIKAIRKTASSVLDGTSMLAKGILKKLEGDLFVLWEAELVECPMMLTCHEGTWILFIDKSVTDFEKTIPLSLAKNWVDQQLLHEVWHFISQKHAIEINQWTSPLDNDAFAPASRDAREEVDAELFGLLAVFGDKDSFLKKVKELNYDMEKISKLYNDAEPEDIAKCILLWDPTWHYFKYSMGKSAYDDELIPAHYDPAVKAKLRDVNYMRNETTALGQAISAFFVENGKTETIATQTTVEGAKFQCYGTYYKFPYMKGKCHNVTCIGRPIK